MSKNLIQQITEDFSKLPEVAAFVLAGSSTSGNDDAMSDYDCYVYSDKEVPVAARQQTAEKYADVMEINNQYWETGDEWQDAESGMIVDIMYRRKDWITGELNRVLVDHQASLGYSTCLWFNVQKSQILYDPSGWYQTLQSTADKPYPPQLQAAIIQKNFPVLRKTIASYAIQLKKALKRRDYVSINHRVAAFLASYFDIIFALNALPHPGEKRLLEIVPKTCRVYPTDMLENVKILTTNISPEEDLKVMAALNNLTDALATLLINEGFTI